MLGLVDKNLVCLWWTEHQNWFGMDDTLGPVAISIRREKMEEGMDSAHTLATYQYRLIVRGAEVRNKSCWPITLVIIHILLVDSLRSNRPLLSFYIICCIRHLPSKPLILSSIFSSFIFSSLVPHFYIRTPLTWVFLSQLFSCQGTVLEESLGRPGGEKGRSPGVRDALEYVCPQLSLSCLRLGQPGSHTEEALARLDELGVHNKFKVWASCQIQYFIMFVRLTNNNNKANADADLLSMKMRQASNSLRELQYYSCKAEHSKY